MNQDAYIKIPILDPMGTANCRLFAMTLALLLGLLASAAHAAGGYGTTFKRIPTQFIAALGAPDATSGDGAETWGWWHLDPGPRGVRLKHFDSLVAAGGKAPARWKFDRDDWWLEENGLIMEQPDFPLSPGQYVVTGNRRMSSILTVHPPDESGNQRWELANGTTLHDVTHLGCRSARYTPVSGSGSCSPSSAPQSVFPMDPERRMPDVAGCAKQEYAVLFIIGVAVGY